MCIESFHEFTPEEEREIRKYNKYFWVFILAVLMALAGYFLWRG